MKRIFFIGIGGIGMSAIARYYKAQGWEVFGYDKTKTRLTRQLEQEGMEIHYVDAIDLIPTNLELVVFTPAIPNTHQQLQALKQSDIPVLKRAAILGEISKQTDCIAIAGTHGKTSTSVLLAYLLKQGGIDINAFLGGISQDFDSNFLLGTSNDMIVEADEFDRSFLHLRPQHAAILSMDADHLDIYGEAEGLIDSGFNAFVEKIKTSGTLLCNIDFKAALKEPANVKTLYFGIERGGVQARNIRVVDGYFVFDFWTAERSILGLKSSMAGDHNIKNAIVASFFALQRGVSADDLRKGLAAFKGIKRRFERVFEDSDRTFIDDYAHHPTELKAAISATRKLFPDRKVTAIFQPHLFSRTKDFAADFAAALDAVDELLLLDIYPARELPMEGVTSEWLASKIKTPPTVLPKSKAMEWVRAQKIEVLLTLGAGNIDTIVEPIKEYLEETTQTKTNIR